MKSRLVIGICVLFTFLSGCGTASSKPAPQPAPTIILHGEPSPIAVSSPPPFLALNQPYQLAPFIITVTRFDTNVDPAIPDIKNAASWTSEHGYRWILLDCLVTNISDHPVAPDIGLIGSLHQQDATENFTDYTTVMNGYDVTDLEDTAQFKTYTSITSIAPHVTIHLRAYFWLADWGLADFLVGTLDPTQPMVWNFSLSHWTNQNVQRFFTVNLPKPTN